MPDQQLRRLVVLGEIVRGANQVLDVGRKIGVGEIAVAGAEPGEIETQHGDALGRERAADARRGGDILAAGKTVREQRKGQRLLRALGQLEQTGSGFSRCVFELQF